MRVAILILIWLVLTPSAWSRILLRWTQAAVPPARSIGVNQLVISWNSSSSGFLESARRQGYRVYVQATPEQVGQIPPEARRVITGIIVEIAASEQPQGDSIIEKLRSSFPRLTFLLLDPNGKQPQMKGTMVVKREGVLEITSPTAQPWIDSNVPLVRFEEGFRPSQIPLYTFAWDASDPMQQKQGPRIEDYTLAIAEANALHADLVLDIHPELQKGLASEDAAAWTAWRKIVPYLGFAPPANSEPASNIAIVTEDYDSAYEPMNLMARHNISFRVIPAKRLTAAKISGLKMLLLFAAPKGQQAGVISDFASAGGRVVTVGLSGSYAWQSAPATRVAEHSTSYALGKGRVIELRESVSDPETFAQDIRRLMKEPDVLLSLWNALTTIGLPYRNSRTGKTMVELVNYAGEPLRVQSRIRGSFQSIRLQTPERGCCQIIHAVERKNATEFVIPELQVAARIHLQAH